MIVKRFTPSPALAPFVRIFEIIETDEPMTRTLIPDPGILIGIRYAGSATLLGATPRASWRLPNLAITGLRTTVRHMHTAANSGIIVTKFHPTGAAAFVPVPLHELFGIVEAFEPNDPQTKLTLTTDLQTATTDTDRIAAVEQFLLSFTPSPVAPDPMAGAAVDAIRTANGTLRVSALAKSLQVSQDTLEKRFRRAVGATPKQFASILRVRRAIQLSEKGATLTTLAQEAGYYDQSHFIRDFRSVTGTAPGQFLDDVDYC